MLLPLTLLLVLFAPNALSSKPQHQKRTYHTHDYYVLEHNPLAGASLAEAVTELGLQLVEPMGDLKNLWIVRAEKEDVAGSNPYVDSALDTLQALRRRASSSSLDSRSEADSSYHARRVSSSIKFLERQELRQRTKRGPIPSPDPIPVPVPQDGEDDSSGEGEKTSAAAIVAERLGIEDPMFPQQWHLVNDEYEHNMMNVTWLWEQGITGEGVISALVDDGLDYTSDDLADNFWAPGSYDFNDHEELPTPKLFDDHHGTRCAGQIGAVKNNVCGMGIAYNSKISGVRILSGPISDIDEAASLNYGYEETSIFSCSWGPPDDGRSMEAPGYLIQKAMLNGVENGRDGKGSIFVFASGNGASSGDQCNFDGYTNSIYSVTVAAIDYKGLHPTYSESCAANMVVAFSSGSGKRIVTTDVGKNKCSSSHGGTSAAAPNAVGVFALALSARPDLTWRDIQHLCVRTADKVNPEDPDWETTASGRLFSYKYGYGALNGVSFVNAAQSWDLVKPQAWLELPATQIAGGTCDEDGNMNGGELIVPGGLTSTVTITQEMMQEHNLEALEHITVRVWITHTRRGDVEVEIVSPNGVKSILGARRLQDADQGGYPGWRFMSVKHWEENPVGDWTIRVSDIGTEGHSGSFLGWRLCLFGSTIDASIATPYELDLFPLTLPTVEPETPTIGDDPSTTKEYTKPTDHLPGDHGEAEGENTQPAFPATSTSSAAGDDASTATPTEQDDVAEETSTSTTTADVSATPSESMIPTADEGWFSDMSSLVSSNKWFFGAVGAVALFGIVTGIYFWRRVARRRRAAYASLPGNEDVAMSSLGRGVGGGGGGGSGRTGRTKELYDAFGEVSDDEDDVDETTGLRSGGGGRENMGATGGIGFHSGFLDDDEGGAGGSRPHSPRSGTPAYRDEPDENERLAEQRHATRTSPDGSGSGDSWEHASRTD